MPGSAAVGGPVRLLDSILGFRPWRWEEAAACRWTANPDAFYPPLYPRADVDAVRRDWCERCPVQVECLRAGMGEDDGIWGGLSPRERAEIQQGEEKAS